MLRAVLVDDEMPSLEALEHVLAKSGAVQVAGKYTDPLEALEKIRETKPELVFMDIEMPELDGFSAAREIINMGFDTHIVFATVFEKYALKAFEIDAADYVVKPFSEHRLRITVDRIIKRVQGGHKAWRAVNALIKQHLSGREPDKIAVWRENSIVLLDLEAILYFTVEEKKVMVHTVKGVYESSGSLAELEERLGHKGFFRCHRAFLVNLDFVDKIDPWFNATYMIRLKQGAGQVPVSRHYTKKLRGMLRI
jgi:DNA-binding LytR/AlgR family response regulator